MAVTTTTAKHALFSDANRDSSNCYGKFRKRFRKLRCWASSKDDDQDDTTTHHEPPITTVTMDTKMDVQPSIDHQELKLPENLRDDSRSYRQRMMRFRCSAGSLCYSIDDEDDESFQTTEEGSKLIGRGMPRLSPRPRLQSDDLLGLDFVD
eukprot:CAMPEP_0116547290 /NCGR_PEP_ID=MMETSP0397-20121206/3696_1 /TAXON_ID=216820 /ORGANISM="Cyclophora tenuis, Strain ECT3854" /LENGTH=150 /DNA_ID=CAMNT_0004071807 /DNA_START=1 /DNA_END=453 /DNA_ORIENTATION=+